MYYISILKGLGARTIDELRRVDDLEIEEIVSW